MSGITRWAATIGVHAHTVQLVHIAVMVFCNTTLTNGKMLSTLHFTCGQQLWHELIPLWSCRSWCKLHEQLTELNETFKKRTEQAALPPPPRLPSKEGEAPKSSSNPDRHTPRDRERAKRSEPDRRHSRDRERDRDRDRYALLGLLRNTNWSSSSNFTFCHRWRCLCTIYTIAPT